MATFLSIVTLSEAAAQESRANHAKEAVLALQPFSLDEPAQVRVAYYVPPRIPHALPVFEENAPEKIPQAETLRAYRIVAGDCAVLRNGIAYAPSNAPDSVKSAISAANALRHKPYVWGGGHASLNDYGYDCSGAVSFALCHANLLSSPLPSTDFLRYGERGRGRWITIYSRPGHTFAIIAGLRFDTTDLHYGVDVGPRWYADLRDTHGFAARHPIGL